MIWKDKRVLVAGGTGMVGRYLCDKLLKLGVHLRIVSLDKYCPFPDAEFEQLDLMYLGNCLQACEDMDYVFNLMGVKGSPAMTAAYPADFMVPQVMFNFALMEAARRNNVDRYLHTSSVGVYSPSEVLIETDVWKTFPSPHDRFAGWAKRISELQAEAYTIQYKWKNIAIVRPSSVYGRYDNFDPETSMVIAGLIRRCAEGENPLRVWGDGSAARDFIHAEDVAEGMLLAIEKMPDGPVNLGSGCAVPIKTVAELITQCFDPPPSIEWDASKPIGDKIRLMDMSKAERELGFQTRILLEDGIRDTVEWYRQHGDAVEIFQRLRDR